MCCCSWGRCVICRLVERDGVEWVVVGVMWLGRGVTTLGGRDKRGIKVGWGSCWGGEESGREEEELDNVGVSRKNERLGDRCS